MPRHIVATLLIGTFVGAALIGLYQTPVFGNVGTWLAETLSGSVIEAAPGLSRPLQLGTILVLGYGAAWVAIDTPSGGARFLFALLAALAVAALSLTLAVYGFLFEPASGIAAVFLATIAGSLYARSEPGKRRHTLRALLAGRANPTLIRLLTEAKHPLRLDSTNRPTAALTCRIVNHDELASSLSAVDFAKITRSFHSVVCNHLISKGGVIDADSPDCTRSYFGLIPTPEELAIQPKPEGKNAPEQPKKAKVKPNKKRGGKEKSDTAKLEPKSTVAPAADPPQKSETESPSESSPPPKTDEDLESDPSQEKISEPSPQISPAILAEKTADACRAALELSPHLHNLSRECEAETGRRLVCGIGIECGPVTTCVINQGSSEHLGAIGSVADFTLRLSAANAIYGSDILIGPEAFQVAREAIEVRPLEMLYNSATKDLDEIYELIDEKGFLSDDDITRREAFWEGVVLLRQECPDEALERFFRSKDGRRHDPPLTYFMEKAKAMREDRKSGTSGSTPFPQHARDTASF